MMALNSECKDIRSPHCHTVEVGPLMAKGYVQHGRDTHSHVTVWYAVTSTEGKPHHHMGRNKVAPECHGATNIFEGTLSTSYISTSMNNNMFFFWLIYSFGTMFAFYDGQQKLQENAF